MTSREPLASFELFGVDAFTDRPFAGNPAAVVTLDEAPWPADGWMQALAAEMNLSETAFVRRLGASTGDGFGLRWFTPATEVDLCGHATVATAHALWHSGRLPAQDDARFETRSGPLRATPQPDGSIELDFPALAPQPRAEAPDGLLAALGLAQLPPTEREVFRSRFDTMVVVAAASTVAAVAPDFPALREVDTRGVIVTAPADPGSGVAFVSRFFAPRAGVDEDPVTGSAHCVLAPYWAARLGRRELRARQISARGGDLRLTLRGDRVGIAGHAVLVHQGRLTL